MNATPAELAQHIEDMAFKAIRDPANREAYLRDIRRKAQEMTKALKGPKGGTDDRH